MSNYIFKLRNGTILNFYYEYPSNYRFRKLINENSWSKSTALISDCTTSLHMDIDTFDNIHIIYQNKEGNIMYCIFDGENLRGHELLKSRTNEQYDRHFRIIPTNWAIHFFYVLHNENGNSLLHQTLSNNEFSVPKVLGSLDSRDILYDAMKDLRNNIHTFFIPAGSDNTILYRKLFNSKDTWNENIGIKHSPGQIKYISSTASIDSNVYLAYQIENRNQESSILLKQIRDGVSSEEISLVANSKSYNHIELKSFMDKCILSLIDNNFAYINQIENRKLLWESPKKIPLNEYRFCNYNSNYPYEIFSISKTPALFGKGISIPLLEKLNMDLSYKNMVQNELLEMRYKIGSLEKQLYNKLTEIDKLQLRIKYMENTKK